MLMRVIAITVLGGLISGCASFSQDAGMSPVVQTVSADLAKDTIRIDNAEAAASAQNRVRTILSKPIGPDQAVQIALLSNRGLQADYNALGIAEADYVASTLPPNPTFSLERMAGTGFLEIERRLVANLLTFATLPARAEIGAKRFEAARYRAIEATFRTAAETRRAWYQAVASAETERFLVEARLSADAAADLTTKLGETGAATKLDQARASAFYAEVSNDLARARLKAVTDREALTRQLGLWGADVDYKLPSRLPALPKKLEKPIELEARAILRRVDLIAQRLELEALAKSLGLTEATRFVSVVELAGISSTEWEREEGETHRASRRGFELEIQIPIFDLGETSVRRARETYMQAVNRLIEKAVNVRSEVRAGYASYRATYDIARQYQNRILPLRRTVSEQAVLEYNGMLKDVFTLLTTARESAASNVAAIGAKRDFFLAAADFQSAMIGGGASSGTATASASAPAEAGGGEH
jgi:outer membrane protein TolC